MLSLFPCLWAPSMVSNANQQATSFFKNFCESISSGEKLCLEWESSKEIHNILQFRAFKCNLS